MNGKVAPETEKPVPVTEAALTVTAAEPVDVKVTDFVAAVFTITPPKDRLVALRLRDEVPDCEEIAGFNCRTSV